MESRKTDGIESIRPARRRTIAKIEIRVLLVPACLAALFLLISFLWTSVGAVSSFDAAVLGALYATPNSDPLGLSWVGGLARDVTSIGSPALLVMIALLGFLWVASHRDRAAAWFVGAAGFGAMGLSFLLKAIYGRPRPPFASAYVLETSPSFPSGHSLMTAALLPAVAIVFLRQDSAPDDHSRFLAFAVVIALLVGLTRVVLGAHYPSDVLAGWSVGFAWVLICRAMMLRVDDS